MIKSILDTDLYKFTTSYAYMKLYPEAEGTFTFYDRGNTIVTEDMLNEIKCRLEELSLLTFWPHEAEWCIKAIPYIPRVYWEWLQMFSFSFDKIKMSLDEEKHLHIEVTDKLYKVTLYEVPILAVVSEVFSKAFTDKDTDVYKNLYSTLFHKVQFINTHNLKFSEFGTRRRYSDGIQELLLKYFEGTTKNLIGTSNVYLSKVFNKTPIGTFPHEWIMFHGAIWGYQEANYLGMRDWVRTYDGDLGIFLVDTYTTKVGLKNMSLKFAKLFDGVRCDSGDEITVGNMVIERYKELGIDPTTKTIVFSNALNFPKYLNICQYFKDKIKVSAGIGTNLTNDVGIQPPNIVMKLSKCRINANQEWRKCIKISDDEGKYLGDPKEFEIAKYQLGL